MTYIRAHVWRLFIKITFHSLLLLHLIVITYYIVLRSCVINNNNYLLLLKCIISSNDTIFLPLYCKKKQEIICQLKMHQHTFKTGQRVPMGIFTEWMHKKRQRATHVGKGGCGSQWRGSIQRRTTLFTSRDGWDSSVGLL